MSSLRSVILFALLAGSAWAKPPKPLQATLTYPAPPNPDERPAIKSIFVGPQGGDYVLRLAFNREPWGEACKNKCANATVFLDLDDDKATGLQFDAERPESGADVAVLVQGLRDLSEGRSAPQLKVRIREYGSDRNRIDRFTQLFEFDLKHDGDRLVMDGNTLYLLLGGAELPRGKKVRVIYHPPDSRALVGTAAGLDAPKTAQVELMRDGQVLGVTWASDKTSKKL